MFIVLVPRSGQQIQLADQLCSTASFCQARDQGNTNVREPQILYLLRPLCAEGILQPHEDSRSLPAPLPFRLVLEGGEQTTGGTPGREPGKTGITGTWINDTSDKCALAMKDPKAGSVVILDDSEDPEFFVRETGGVLFANLKVEDEDYHAWAEQRLKNNELHIRHPDLDKFAKLIADQMLEARIIQEDRFRR